MDNSDTMSYTVKHLFCFCIHTFTIIYWEISEYILAIVIKSNVNMHIIICKNWIYATQSKHLSKSLRDFLFVTFTSFSWWTRITWHCVLRSYSLGDIPINVREIAYPRHGLVKMVDMFWPTKYYYYNNLQCHEHPPPPNILCLI